MSSRRLSKLGQAALDYAAHGWKVIPLRPGTKKAIPEGSFHAATDDPETIRRWWTATPKANVAIACGMSELVVIDLDQKNGKNGRAEWERLAIAHGFQPNGVLTATTANGGIHLYYRMPAQRLKTKTNALAVGVDVLGDNGQVVAPPSIIDGMEYAWADGDHVPGELPAAVVDLLTSPPDPWRSKCRTLADLRKPRAPMRWVVDAILPERGLVVLFGQPGGFKSAIAADIAGAVLSGQAWLSAPDGHGGQDTTSGGVLWVNFDQGEHVLAERLEAMAEAWQLPDDAPLIAYSHPAPRLDAANADQIADLIKRGEGSALIVIDALTHIRGGADEREEGMAAVMDGLRALAEHTGACVLVLHHEKKSQGMGGRDGERMRGSSTIEAGADICLLVTREGNRAKVKATKSRLSDVPEVSAQWSFEHKPGTRELATARFWPVDEIREAREELEAKILAVIEDAGQMAKGEIAKATKSRREIVFEALGRLHLDGRLTVSDGPRGAKNYAIA